MNYMNYMKNIYTNDKNNNENEEDNEKENNKKEIKNENNKKKKIHRHNSLPEFKDMIIIEFILKNKNLIRRR